MIYVYDILLNWTDIDFFYEFYEWKKGDSIEHIKKIPLIKIGKEQLTDFFHYQVIVDNDFLKKIEKMTEVFRNKKIEKIPYACILSDGNQSLAIELNKKGEIIYHSRMMLDEEEDIIDLASKIDFIDINYKKLEKINRLEFYTRKEREEKLFLKKEFDFAYRQKDETKLTYLYEEYFNDKMINLDEMYHKLCDSLEDFTEKHHGLYELLKLSHTQK